MINQRSIRLPLAGAIALVMAGAASIAMAQPALRQPSSVSAQGASGPAGAAQFEQGTVSSATYPLPDSHGGTLTVNAGMPASAPHYGPPPSFKSLDSNHDGRISEAEARAYPPLDSEFLLASGQATTISRAQYRNWVRNLGG